MEDGDVDKAVEGAMLSKYLNQGQVCTCSERFYLHGDVYDEFLQKYVDASSKLKLGDPMQEDTDIGPKVSLVEREKMEALVQRAIEPDAKLSLVENVRRGRSSKKDFSTSPRSLLEPPTIW